MVLVKWLQKLPFLTVCYMHMGARGARGYVLKLRLGYICSMGLRIGGGFGLGPVGVGGGFRVGGGRRSRSSGDAGGFFGLVLIALGILAAIVLGLLIICFSIGFLIAHLAGSGGLKSSNRRPWISRFLLSFGVLVAVYLVNRGGLGSVWSNFDFGDNNNTWSDDWRLLYELGLWSLALGLLLSTPAHWMICTKHHPNRNHQQRSAGEYIKKYWLAYTSLSSLIGLGLLIWMFVDEDRMLETPGGLLAFIIIYGVIGGVFLLYRVVPLIFRGLILLASNLTHGFSAPRFSAPLGANDDGSIWSARDEETCLARGGGWDSEYEYCFEKD